MHPTLLRTTVLVTAVLAMFAVGCAKKGATPPTPPPAGNTTTAPTNPNPGNTGGTTTNPTTPGSQQGTATVTDLRTIYFAVDSYSIDGTAQADLDANAKLLRANSNLRVTVEGHCDERGTVEYNLALGQKRADAVRDYLLGAGVSAAQIATLTRGKEFPAVDGHDESAWAKNRRAEFK
ncbi:MAG: peptidoglycan-associated lipoprotein Pal [Candidatus Eisenbacteria bacterium]|uniref:Peptidoglycan-associated lipoprotein n=1 Tax=Eiseniibacteriota bacterium TaxID=2212470 RepID=A0A933SEP0_UNCEI|nr:peptidoglycan-associated lipoprotein Pal [Candidatus Eisenbacteria bacterium]